MPAIDIYNVSYGLVSYGLALLLLLLAGRQRHRTIFFLLASLALLVIARVPFLFFNQELNPDESQVLSHTLTLLQHPGYWQSVDGQTIGPLNIYALVIPGAIGFPVDYTTARLVGLFLLSGALFFFWKTVALLRGAAVATISVLSPLFLLAFTRHPDFIHYSSEQLPLFLLSLVLYLLIKLYLAASPAPVIGFLSGLVAGMVPFAKLQAVPMALVLAFAAVYHCWNKYRQGGSVQALAATLAGGITFPLLVLAYVFYNQVWEDFIQFYIGGNVIYAGGNNLFDIPVTLGRLLWQSPDFLIFTGACLLPLLFTRFRLSRTGTLPAVTALFYLLASLYAITKSGNLFVHYLHLGIFPLAFGVALFITPDTITYFRISAVLLLSGFLLSDLLVADRFPSVRRQLSARKLQRSAVVETALPYTKPGDNMVVWGWRCQYYVEAQLPQGTAESHSERCVFDHPMRDAYRSRYLSDLKRNRPAIFIDATGKNSLWLQDPLTQSYKVFPDLAVYIDQNYTRIGEAGGNQLYVRNDRVPPRAKIP